MLQSLLLVTRCMNLAQQTDTSFTPAEQLQRVLRDPAMAAWADKEQVPAQETKKQPRCSEKL